MKFSWSETILCLSILSLTVTMSAEFISDYIGIDAWTILYFGIGLMSVAVLILIYRIILKFKKKK